MGMSEISTWVLIRRYDRLEHETGKVQSNLHRLTLTFGSVPDDLRTIIFGLIGIENDGSRVLKVRRYDKNLVPLSTLLNGSDRNKPFIIDVVRVHQFCPVEKRTVLPSYIEALESKFSNLEKRVIFAEKALPDITAARIQAVEDATSQLANCLSFLDRRLDELAPAEWRSQINSGI